jgi:type II secretory pathway pseudopilin PulG
MTGRVARDEGETLIEILISVAIMGIVMVGMIASLTTATIASDNHRRLTDVEIVARAYGEAVINQALHPVTTTLTAAVSSGGTVLLVTSSSGFATTSMASVDGEVVDLKSVAPGKLTLNSGLTADYPAGSPVTVYQPCPVREALEVSGFTFSADRVDTPYISQVEYFAQPANAGVAPSPVSAAACSNYWDTAGLPCSLYDTPHPHYTECDPPLIRVTITVDGTEGVNNARRATTTTRVYINRANA